MLAIFASNCLKRKGSSFSLSDHRPEASLPAVVRCEICKYPKLVNIWWDKSLQTAIKAYTQQRPGNNTTVFQLPPRFSGIFLPHPTPLHPPEVTPGVWNIWLAARNWAAYAWPLPKREFSRSIFDGLELHRLTASWLPCGSPELIKTTLRCVDQSDGILSCGIHSSCCLLTLFTHNLVINAMPTQFCELKINLPGSPWQTLAIHPSIQRLPCDSQDSEWEVGMWMLDANADADARAECLCARITTTALT